MYREVNIEVVTARVAFEEIEHRFELAGHVRVKDFANIRFLFEVVCEGIALHYRGFDGRSGKGGKGAEDAVRRKVRGRNDLLRVH